MTYKPREIESMLLTKLQMVTSNTDHTWYELSVNGLPTIRTKLSFTRRKDIGDALLSRISKQLRIRKLFFIELMTCTKSKEEYINQISQDPFPPFNVPFV